MFTKDIVIMKHNDIETSNETIVKPEETAKVYKLKSCDTLIIFCNKKGNY